MISNIFHTIFYQPLLNALILLYQIIPGNDFGIAVLCLTLLIKFLLFPINLKSIKSQKIMSKLQSELEEVKSKFKDNKEEMVKQTMLVYQREKINPFSGLFLVLLQLPILFALYKVFSKSVSAEEWRYLYSFVPVPQIIEPKFLMINLAQPNFILAFLAGIAQFIQTKIQSASFNFKKSNKDSNSYISTMQKQMIYFFPAFTFFILLKIPSAIGLYLIASTIFTILQTMYVQKKPKSHV